MKKDWECEEDGLTFRWVVEYVPTQAEIKASDLDDWDNCIRYPKGKGELEHDAVLYAGPNSVELASADDTDDICASCIKKMKEQGVIHYSQVKKEES